MPRLLYHPGSDCLWTEQHQHIDWSHLPGEEVEDVSDDRACVDRYNRENPGYMVHKWHGPQDHADPEASDRCQACVLALCIVCGAGECELTTDCPGHRVSDARREEVCAGRLDYWSGVWL
jgi:hypothetical protein